MENWGLVTYNERNFLNDENSAQSIAYNVIRVMSHEIAHMWFGNLVTPK